MAETLYRKYRPQIFAEIVNQQHIRITLQHALEQDRVAHAYLFAGPRGVGKTTIARLLARAVNCEKRSGAEPCNQCQPCQAMNEGRNLDIIEIDAASQTGVDNVRENIIQSARVAPSLGKMKVFIIDEVHMLSLAAFNALLKLLEEPPAHALFILATTEIHRVPETIISRTQRFDFKKLGSAEIAKRLEDLAGQEKRTLGDGVAERIARFADGSLRDAESMLGQLFSFQDKTIDNDIADLVLPRSNEAVLLEIIQAVTRGQAVPAIQAFHTFCDEGGDIPTLAHDLVEISRGLLLGSVDTTLLDRALRQMNPATTKQLLDILKTGTTERFLTMVETFTLAERQLYRGAMMEIPVEVAIVKLADTTDDEPSPPASPPARKQAELPKTQPKSAAKTPTKKTGGNVSLESAAKAWKSMQRGLAKAQPSFRLSVQQAWVADTEPGKVILGVPFALHQQRLTDPKNRKGLEEQMSKTIGKTVGIDVRVEADAAPTAAPESSTPAPTPNRPTKESTGDLWDQVVQSFS